MKINAAQTVAKTDCLHCDSKRKAPGKPKTGRKNNQLNPHAFFTPFVKLRCTHAGANFLFRQNIGELDAGDGILVTSSAPSATISASLPSHWTGSSCSSSSKSSCSGGLVPCGSGGWAFFCFLLCNLSCRFLLYMFGRFASLCGFLPKPAGPLVYITGRRSTAANQMSRFCTYFAFFFQ